MKKATLTLLCLFLSIPCYARTITVNADGSGEYPTIQAAIDDANDGDVIILEPGRYTGDGNRDIDFLGKAITISSTDPNDPNIVAETIIDCNGTEDDPHRGFHFQNGEGAYSVLAGLTINKGYQDGQGGGIYCSGSSPTVTNCTFSENSAAGTWGGGAISCEEKSSPSITNCFIITNAAAGYGGGILCKNSSPVITDCTISGNSGGRGEAICCYQDSNPIITRCIITGKGPYGVAAIYCYNASPTITNCLISGDSSAENKKFGTDGICCRMSNPTIINCTIAGNSGDGINSYYYSNPLISNCIIRDNSQSQIDGSASVTYSNIEDTWPGEGNIDKDPCFALNTDYHLLADSPCINAGDPCYPYDPNETDLDGNPRIIDGRIDMGAYEYLPPLEARLWILPRTINRKSNQKNIMAWLRLPAGISRDDIDSNVPLTLYPGQIEASRQFIFENKRRDRTNTSILAFFKKSDLMNAIPEDGQVQLEAVGQLNTGRYFFGQRTVRIINPPHRRPWHP